MTKLAIKVKMYDEVNNHPNQEAVDDSSSSNMVRVSDTPT